MSAVGLGTAYVCTADHTAQVCSSGKPLTFQAVPCVRLSGKNGDRFSFKTWSGDGAAYTSNVVAAQFTNEPYGPKA